MNIFPLLFMLAFQSQPQVPANPQVKPGWQWTDAEIKAAANKVRAGKSLKPVVWPNNSRVAVALSFDFDNDTTQYRSGEPSPGPVSQGEYGARVGLDRVLALLDKHQIPASFFIPSVSMMLYPTSIEKIRKAGRHEFGIHGWIHELNSMMNEADERALMRKAVDYYVKTLGKKPAGYRAPSWNFSPNTLKLLREFGFFYDSSLMSDDSPYEINADGGPTGLVELPVEWILDDAPFNGTSGTATRYSPPRDVLQVYIDEFDKAYEEGGLFLLTTHPHIIGHRSRIIILEKLIEHILKKGSAWFATHEQVARYVKK